MAAEPPIGILLAGGTGSRLLPLTQAVNKHLLNIYDKPLIYYSLSLLMLAGVRQIVVICRAEDMADLKALLGDGRRWGLAFSYTRQDRPNGIAEALILAAPVVRDRPSVLVLGDNIIYGANLSRILLDIIADNRGASILGYPVSNPRAFGVVELDENDRPISLEEKPESPRSDLAVPGFYCYDNTAVERARSLKPSLRGELEITDLNRLYLEDGALQVYDLGRGSAWLDGGEAEGLFEAAQFVRVMQTRTGLIIASPEEIAWNAGWITDDEFLALCRESEQSAYGRMLLKRAIRGAPPGVKP